MSSKPKNILFRADSSSTIGTGHIMRDLVLAKRYPKATITFAVQNLDGNINHKIKEAGYRLEILKSNSIKKLDKLVKKLQIDMIVIDHYDIDWKYEKQLSILNSQLSIMVLDDTYQKHHCDILLNHNISADVTRYKGLVPPNCKLQCGSTYTLIRDEFKIEKPIKREKIYDVFIAMGGTDASSLNIPILEKLPINLQICIVTTTANAKLKELQEFLTYQSHISLHVDTKEMAKLLNQSKFAIITPSVVVHEVLYMNIPFLAIKIASNQDDIYEYLKANKYNVMERFEAKKFIVFIKYILKIKKVKQ